MENNNRTLTENLNEIFDLKNGDFSSNEVIPVINPVLSIEPKMFLFSRATSGTTYTTPIDKDFYLKSIVFSETGDDTQQGTLTFSLIEFTDDTGTLQTLSGTLYSGTGFNTTCNLFFDFAFRGIKIQRGSNINILRGNASTCFTGYFQEVKK